MNKEMLKNLILITSERSGINSVIIEKDYYVSLLLFELSKKQALLKAYFKGGTAVYKILNSLNRFSEDIDLTVFVDNSASNTSNRKRLKDSALSYSVAGLDLDSKKTIDKKGSITSFYEYNSFFNITNEFNYVKVEATSFTLSDPIKICNIYSLIYKYATSEERVLLKEYGITNFNIMCNSLERIFIDKIFAAQCYYERGSMKNFSKHIYDICVLFKEKDIKKFLLDTSLLNEVVNIRKKEEINRLDSVNNFSLISNFEYLKNGLSIKEYLMFDKMQEEYILGEDYKLSLNEINGILKDLLLIFKNSNN